MIKKALLTLTLVFLYKEPSIQLILLNTQILIDILLIGFFKPHGDGYKVSYGELTLGIYEIIFNYLLICMTPFVVDRQRRDQLSVIAIIYIYCIIAGALLQFAYQNFKSLSLYCQKLLLDKRNKKVLEYMEKRRLSKISN